MINVHILPILTDNYAYLVEQGFFCVIIDPGEADPILSYLKEKGITPKAILLTHDHSDHISGLNKIKEEYDIPVMGARGLKFANVDVELQEGRYEVCQMIFDVIATPGHTMTHIVFYFPKIKTLFSGDTLFAMGCGRLFEGVASDMFQSFQKLKKLPKETKVYAGHEYTQRNLAFAKTVESKNVNLGIRESKIAGQTCTMPFTLQEEFDTNPFFRTKSKEIISNVKGEKEIEVFTILRKLRNDF